MSITLASSVQMLLGFVSLLYGSCFLFLVTELNVPCQLCNKHSIQKQSQIRSSLQKEQVQYDKEGEPYQSLPRRQLETTARNESVSELWEVEPFASHLPQWMKNYFIWHRTVLRELEADPTNWTSYKYLVVRCLEIDQKCGGASDRLQSIPLALWIASQHDRLLFIEWEKPAPLSSFLQPTALNWRIPSWMHKVHSLKNVSLDQPFLHFQRSPTILSDKHMGRLNTHSTLVDMRYQTNDHGREYYNSLQEPGDPDFDSVYAFAWACLFQPSPAVQSLIDETTKDLGLDHEAYISLHIRSMYYKDKSQQIARVENAIHCAMKLPSDGPIYVASDSETVSRKAVDYGLQIGRKVVSTIDGDDRLHLDRGSSFLSASDSNWKQFDASSYLNIFVDLFLLSRGQCVAFNVGGYGRWASLLSLSSTCGSLPYHRLHCEPPEINNLS